MEEMELLLNKMRVLKMFQMFDFVGIVRHFKSQVFDSMANRCKAVIHCAKCSGKHFHGSCYSNQLVCYNC